ncbi:hypothetical protein [Flavobacterium sp. GNP002]
MQFSKYNNDRATNFTAEDPNICPHCHVAIEPTLIFNYYDRQVDKLFSLWNCTFNKCGKTFIVSHYENEWSSFTIERNLNGFPKGPNWPQPILNLKNGQTVGTEKEEDSKFITTYLQSLEAESNGLSEIAGMGFRKAIEYLVKDWAIQTNPDAKEKILEDWLSTIIRNHFTGELKDILERATWLGNDQTHYNKLFEEFNVQHLKELIDLIMVELDREFKKRHYIENIEKRK